MRAARIQSLTVAIALIALFVGCQSTPDPSIELLENELRWYEEQLYLMDRELGACHQRLESARRYNSALKAEMERAGGFDAATESDKSSERKNIFPFGIQSGNSKSPDSNPANSGSDSNSDDDLSVPPISRGIPEAPEPSNGTDDADEVPEATLGPVDSDQDKSDADDVFDDDEGFDQDDPFTLEEISLRRSNRDNTVAQVVFNSRLTGGHNSDGHAGDDGLYVVLEPKSARGDYLETAGELTIEVFDAHRPRSFQSRIARWDFGVDETAAALRTSLLGKGVHLELSWPAEPPQITDLVVVAKFVRSDGKRLTAERSFKIDPTGARAIPSDQIYSVGSSPVGLSH